MNRRPRVKNERHLKFIRGLYCVICGSGECDAAHIRTGSRKWDKDYTGMGRKPDDKWTLPLCRPHHTEQHGMNEMAFWEKYDKDPFSIANDLYSVTGNHEAGLNLLRNVR